MNTYNLKLDLNKGPTYNVGMAYSGITLRQGDKRGCTVVAELYDHGTRFTEAGYTAYFVMGLPDREHYYREAATYSAGTATIIIDESLAASVAGDTIAYFELTKGGATYSTQGIKVSVLKDARADKTPGETYDSRIEQAIQDLEDAIAGIDVSIEADVAEWLDQHPEATTTVQDNSITYAKLHSSTKQRLNNKLHRLVTAPVVTASDAYAAPPVALVVDGKSVQDGTPTPDAPVAIQSVESVGLAAAGRNLWHGPTSGGRTNGGITWTYNADGTLTADGTSTNNSWSHSGTVCDVLLSAGTYTASVPSAFGLVIYNVDEGATIYNNTGSSHTFTLTEGATIRVFARANTGTTFSNVTLGIMLEVGSTASAWARPLLTATAIPLQGHALRSLPDGTHDELRVDADGNVTLVQRVGHVVLDGSENWYFSSAQGHTFAYVPLPSVANPPSSQVNIACDRFTVALSTNAEKVYQSGPNALFWTGGSYNPSKAAEAKAWAASNPITVLYQLATPVEIPLGTVTLPALPAPDLTAWASCTPATEIGLDYERDVTIAVERLEAAIAELATN